MYPNPENLGAYLGALDNSNKEYAPQWSIAMALTDTSCKNAKPSEKPRKLSDGGGLYLEVMPSRSKYWRLKYRFSGKEKRLAIGVYPQISLKEARIKRDEAKKLLSENIDPSQAKQDAKRQNTLKTENLFEEIAREWHEKQSNGWTERHAKYVLVRLEADIFPELGNIPTNEIKAPDLLAALRKIEDRGALDIAKRARQTCGQIFRYAIATGRAERDIAVDLKGALKVAKKKHHAHLQESELPELLEKLDLYDGEPQTKLAIKFTLLTFTRSGEVRGAEWSEIDFDKEQWIIPAQRMKMRVKHIVPLSSQVLAILKELIKHTGNEKYLFPSHNNSFKPISENTMLYAIYRMGYHSRTTIHGFRSTASTILNENGFPPDHIERQLAHAERNGVRAAYNHAEYLPERHKMMQWWGNYLYNKGK